MQSYDFASIVRQNDLNFPSIQIPCSMPSPSLPQASSVPDHLIYLSLLASYQRAFAANPQLLGDRNLIRPQVPVAHQTSPFANSSVFPTEFGSYLDQSIPADRAPPLSPPMSPVTRQGSGSTCISPAELACSNPESRHEEPANYARRSMSVSPPPLPQAKWTGAPDIAALECNLEGSGPVGLMTFEDYLSRVEAEMDGEDGGHLDLKRDGGSAGPGGKAPSARSLKSRRGPLTAEDKSVRRDKNLQAARRCRLRKALRVRWLESRCEELERENAKIEEKLAALEKRLPAHA